MPKLVIYSHRAYPFGGGEEDLYEKAQIARGVGWDVIWVSHATGQGREVDCETTSRTINGISTIIVPSSPWEPVSDILKSADVVLAIGRAVVTLSEKYPDKHMLPWIAAFHFWTGLIKLGPAGNMHLLKTLLDGGTCSVSPEWPAIHNSSSACAVVSPFMQDMAASCGVNIPWVLPSVPAHQLKPQTQNDSLWDAVLVNTHTLKGGAILGGNSLDTFSLLGVVTEEDHDHAFYTILTAMARKSRTGRTILRSRMPASQMNTILTPEGTRCVIAASLVDETFGRVAALAIANSVPTFLSPRGNLFYLGGDSWPAYLENPENYEDSATQVAHALHDPHADVFKRTKTQAAQQSILWLNFEVEARRFLALLNDIAVPNKHVRPLFVVDGDHYGQVARAAFYSKLLSNHTGPGCALLVFNSDKLHSAQKQMLYQSCPRCLFLKTDELESQVAADFRCTTVLCVDAKVLAKNVIEKANYWPPSSVSMTTTLQVHVCKNDLTWDDDEAWVRVRDMQSQGYAIVARDSECARALIVDRHNGWLLDADDGELETTGDWARTLEALNLYEPPSELEQCKAVCAAFGLPFIPCEQHVPNVEQSAARECGCGKKTSIETNVVVSRGPPKIIKRHRPVPFSGFGKYGVRFGIKGT